MRKNEPDQADWHRSQIASFRRGSKMRPCRFVAQVIHGRGGNKGNKNSAAPGSKGWPTKLNRLVASVSWAPTLQKAGAGSSDIGVELFVCSLSLN